MWFVVSEVEKLPANRADNWKMQCVLGCWRGAFRNGAG